MKNERKQTQFLIAHEFSSLRYPSNQIYRERKESGWDLVWGEKSGSSFLSVNLSLGRSKVLELVWTIL